MKALQICRQGEPVADNVVLNDACSCPEPGPGQVRVRTEASALNQLDLWVGRGVPGFDVSYPAISGSDGVGLVDAVGEGVSDTWIGRRVILNAAVTESVMPLPDDMEPAPGTHMIGEHGSGTMAESFVAPVENVCDVGDVDPVEAAAPSELGYTESIVGDKAPDRSRLRTSRNSRMSPIVDPMTVN